jgi:gamma-glutamyltranspeptidase / glutathione hydrolase
MVCSVDHLASGAGISVLQAGGNAVDAAVATSAVLAVTTQHMCGMGGDLFALVHHTDGEPPSCLNASGRAGSGADAEGLRSEGHRRMPTDGDVRAVTVPGCVDGWLALLERHGRLPVAEVFEPARSYAEEGFPASPQLAAAISIIAGLDGADDYPATTRRGDLITRPGVARTLEAIVEGGRAAFYEGEFGAGLLRVGAGLFDADDLARSQADWVSPLGTTVWGHQVFTIPPNSQGYLALAAARIAEMIGIGPTERRHRTTMPGPMPWSRPHVSPATTGSPFCTTAPTATRSSTPTASPNGRPASIPITASASPPHAARATPSTCAPPTATAWPCR